MVKELELKYFKNRESLRNWLEENCEESPGIWVIMFKKHIKTECINYNEILEEALCFGWIDSLIKKLDDDRYARKITPRTNTKKWSELNKRIAADLIKSGRMTQAGLRKTIIGSNDNMRVKTPEEHIKSGEIPEFILKEFAENEPALKNFNSLAPTYKKHYALWITNARRDETIMKRLKEAVGLLINNQKLGLK